LWKKSLKARLTVYVVLPVMLTLIIIGGIGFYSAYNETQEIYDTELSHVANLMLSLLQAEDQEELKHGRPDNKDEDDDPDIIELGNDFDGSQLKHDGLIAFRIWRNNKLLFYSQKAADFGEKHVTAGFSNQKLKGQEWRFYVLPNQKGGYTIEFAQKSNVRAILIARILTTIFSPLAVLLPIVLIVVWVGLRRGLKPLLAVSDAVRHRSSLDLTPLPACQSLKEIAPLIDSINGLLANLDYALKKERRFTDFAAHELRTPIAIFKTQAQTALKATDEMQRRTILEAQVQAADRATNMVDQLLSLARLEHTDIPTEALSIGAIAREIIIERLPLAQHHQLDLLFEGQAEPLIYGNKDLFSIILSNLIDNAIKYTPSGGDIIVSVGEENGQAYVTVRDTGPGIPEEKLPFVTERFYRVTRHQQSGAGLGLTIVKRAADIMGATLTLHNNSDGHGLEVLLHFAA
jgi:two-component system sensor histidine kinase QseC